jgi:large subunit ribosomal protein L18
MPNKNKKAVALSTRRLRVRKKIIGTAERPRLSVRRSLKHIYAQVIDDGTGTTLAEASTVSAKVSGSGVAAAKEVGKALAERARAKSIGRVTFDRGGRQYHGRVKALAEGAREGGLEF